MGEVRYTTWRKGLDQLRRVKKLKGWCEGKSCYPIHIGRIWVRLFTTTFVRVLGSVTTVIVKIKVVVSLVIEHKCEILTSHVSDSDRSLPIGGIHEIVVRSRLGWEVYLYIRIIYVAHICSVKVFLQDERTMSLKTRTRNYTEPRHRDGFRV